MASQRIDSLTGLRGIAALIVVIYHYTGGFLPNLDLTEYTLFVRKGYLWVDLFFLLSGFVIAHVYGPTFSRQVTWRTTGHFIVSRLARLYPLHITILAGFIILELTRLWLETKGFAEFRQSPFDEGRTIEALLANVLMLHSIGLQSTLTWNGPAWSIGAEWFAYLAFPFVAILLCQGHKRTKLAFLALSIGSLAAISKGGRDLDVTYDFGLWRCLAEFLLGLLIYRLYWRYHQTRHTGHDMVLLLLFAVTGWAMHVGWRDILIIPLFTVLIIGLAHNKGRIARVFSYRPMYGLGAISYSVYMSHMLLLEIANTISRVLSDRSFGSHFDQNQSIGILFLMTFLVLAVSGLLYCGIEKPARRAIRKSALVRKLSRETVQSPLHNSRTG
ncbi:acyltransferase family protein [Thalassospira australica]|uniref:acyltransferase family protein n=1 Tax=Thalassospira australica TaxID=1528106 RepID=UPI00384D0DC3